MNPLKWNPEQLEAVAALAEAMQAEEQPELTTEQNLKNALLRRMTDIDAAQVVADLKNGIDTFHQTLEGAQAGGLPAVARQTVEELLQGRSEPEQAELLSQLLAAFARAAGHPDPALPSDPEHLDELKEAVCTYISEYGIIHLHSEAAEILLCELDEDSLKALETAQLHACGEAYMALAMYLLKLQGELDAIPDEMSAAEIGAAAAAAAAANQTIASGLIHKLPIEKIIEALKVIAAAALLAILVVAAVRFALFTGTLTFYVARITIGLGVVGLIGAAIFGFAAVRSVVETVIEAGRLILKTSHLDTVVESGRSRLADWLRENVLPRAEAFWRKLRDKAALVEPEEWPQAEEQPAEEEDASPAYA